MRRTLWAQSFVIRPAKEADVRSLVALSGEHSADERAAWSADGKRIAAQSAVRSDSPPLCVDRIDRGTAHRVWCRLNYFFRLG
jgi:hypothetical protein